MLIKQFAKVLSVIVLAVLLFLSFKALTVHADEGTGGESTNFSCPSPSEVQSTDFTVPSVWIAPPMAQSEPGQVGAGLGGKYVGRLLGSEPAMVGGHEGWVCIYQSKGGKSIRDYEKKLREIAAGNKFLTRQLQQIDDAFENNAPYLKKYPKDEIIGVVGYQLPKSYDQQQQSYTPPQQPEVTPDAPVQEPVQPLQEQNLQ